MSRSLEMGCLSSKYSLIREEAILYISDFLCVCVHVSACISKDQRLCQQVS